MNNESAPVLFATPEITEADIDAVTSVLRSGWITTGTEGQRLEADLAEYLGAHHALAVSSCTAALEIALAHLELPPGARVGVPAWTFISSALSAVHNNLQPVLLDVDPLTLNLCPDSLAATVSTLDAVVAVHFGGVPVSAEIHAICAEADVPVIEDAAHALGAVDERGPIGSQGTVCFSFYATKNLTSAEGGALVTDSPLLAAFAKAHRQHGMSADALARYKPGSGVHYDLESPGIKANLPDVLAALARSQLTRFDASQARRRALARRYRSTLSAASIQLVPGEAVAGSADHLTVVMLPEQSDRESVISGLQAQGISPSVHFRPLHHFTWFEKNVDIGASGLDVCDALADRALSLPLHVGLTDADVDRVCEVLVDLVDR